MHAISMLEAQHREVERLFTEYERCRPEDHARKQALFEELADRLAVHTTLEERVFYPGVFLGDTEEQLREAVEEHLIVKRLIADLLDLEPRNPQFDAKISALREAVRHHVEDEEGELFPKIRKMFSLQELRAMAEQMRTSLETLEEEGDPRERVTKETSEAPPLH